MSLIASHAFNPTSSVRSLLLDEQPWFFASDVCRAVDLSDTNKALLGLDPDEKCELEDYSGSGRKPILINESGLFSLVLRSRKPQAKAFKKWVTSEVLPSIRKTGSYSVQPVEEQGCSQEEIAALKAVISSIQAKFSLYTGTRSALIAYAKTKLKVSSIHALPRSRFTTVYQSLQLLDDRAALFADEQAWAHDWLIGAKRRLSEFEAGLVEAEEAFWRSVLS